MALSGYVEQGGVFIPNLSGAAIGTPQTVDKTYDKATASENPIAHNAVASAINALIGGAASDSDTLAKLNTKLSTVSAGLEYKGNHDLAGGSLPTETEQGKMYSLSGSAVDIGGTTYRPGFLIISNKANPAANVPADWDVIDLSAATAALPLSSLQDENSNQVGGVSGALLAQTLADWYADKVDQTYDAATTSTKALSHAAVASAITALIAGAPTAGNDLNKLFTTITALTNRVSSLETNPLVKVQSTIPTAADVSPIIIYEDGDLSDGDASRVFAKIAGSYYGVLQAGDFSSN